MRCARNVRADRIRPSTEITNDAQQQWKGACDAQQQWKGACDAQQQWKGACDAPKTRRRMRCATDSTRACDARLTRNQWQKKI